MGCLECGKECAPEQEMSKDQSMSGDKKLLSAGSCSKLIVVHCTLLFIWKSTSIHFYLSTNTQFNSCVDSTTSFYFIEQSI